MKTEKSLFNHATLLLDPRDEDESTHATSTPSQSTSQSVSSARQELLQETNFMFRKPIQRGYFKFGKNHGKRWTH